jgi:organic anion transporter 4A
LSNVSGLVAVPGAGGGTLLGGYLIKRFDMKLPAIIRLCWISTLLAGLSTVVFVFNCDDVEIAGVTVPYQSPLDVDADSAARYR